MAPVHILLRPLFLSCVLILGGCAGQPIASFASGRPLFDPMKFFAGHTHSWGLFETRRGAPGSLFTTTTDGQVIDGVLHFEQDLAFADGKRLHRSWLVRRLDAHHFTATGTGIVGVARGTASGNVFHLEFTLDALPGNPFGHLHMSQWMYLQADGRTMVNRDALTKAGLLVAQVTEQFNKDR